MSLQNWGQATLLGGRSVHPNGVKVGGFYRAPLVEEIEVLIPRLKLALIDAADVIKWLGGISFPEHEIEFMMVSLRHEYEYPVLADHIITSNNDQL